MNSDMSLVGKLIIFRVDASLDIGTGHAMRRLLSDVGAGVAVNWEQIAPE